ncbi:hypothetical protein [Aureispira anguillae]|nr:hypothetical protein [Aureispira anguillae]
MIHPFYIFLFPFVFLNNQQHVHKKIATYHNHKNVLEIQVRKDSSFIPQIHIDNKNDYSETFISDLKTIKGLKRADLKGNRMILNEKDTFYFPPILKQKKRIVLTARKDNLAIALTIQQINQTSIKYQLEMVEFGKTSTIRKGIANLSAFFFLASETNTYEKTGVGYLATSFSDKSKSCLTEILIGNMDDAPNKPFLVKLTANCNQGIRDINLKNFPTLREK